MTSPLPADDSVRGYRFVATPEELAAASEEVGRARAVAVDIEADSMHSFFEKVCLVQLATDHGHAFVVDPLTIGGLGPLGPHFADPRVVKVFHGADFDVMSLRRDHGFEFRNIFDTMVASMLLGDERLSLRDLVLRFFDVALEKAYTRSDWSRRPLEPEQIEYCYQDVAYLVPLMEIQHQRLRDADLYEEAQIEFDRLALREAAKKEFDPHGWVRIKGARELPPGRQSVLAALYTLRDRLARQLDRPPFKVMGNDTLLRVAQAAPRQPEQLRRLKGVSSFVAGRASREVLLAIQEGLERGEPEPRPRRGRGDPSQRMDMAAQQRLGNLKDWRNAASARSGITTLAILPNYAMFEVARLRPRNTEELGGIPGVGRKRAERWGDEILPLLR